jgi:hypothetical protein
VVAPTRYGWEEPRLTNAAGLAGEAADLWLRQGYLARSRTERMALLDQNSDDYTLAKLALSEMLTLVLAGDLKGAHRLWRSSDQPSTPLARGVALLEQGRTSLRDQMLFRQLEALLHSLNPDQGRALEAVDSIMETLCGWAREKGDDWMLALALRNWWICLQRAFKGIQPSEDALSDWRRWSDSYRGCLRPTALSFGWPDRWQAPSLDELALKKSAPRPFWKRLLGRI